MTKLARFFATCLLALTLSMAAFAGETQGPGSPEPPPPPPPGETQGPGMPVSADSTSAQDANTSSDLLIGVGEAITDWYLAIF